MNRRSFLLKLPCIYHDNFTNTKPTNVTLFESKNKRLRIYTKFTDNGSHVVVYNNKQWYDPISRKDIIQTDEELFILDSDDV